MPPAWIKNSTSRCAGLPVRRRRPIKAQGKHAISPRCSSATETLNLLDGLVAVFFGILDYLTAPSVVPENKLRLCHDRDELTIRRCDARLPDHRSPPAMQGHRFADNPTAEPPIMRASLREILLAL
jgi:hypothetical protein